MNILTLAKAVPFASMFVAVIFSTSAQANPSDGAAQLLPLETRALAIEQDTNLYDYVADDINNPDEESANTSDITDLFGAGFLEGLVNENGDVELPLGITVFDAMGTTSVGFGSEF